METKIFKAHRGGVFDFRRKASSAVYVAPVNNLVASNPTDTTMDLAWTAPTGSDNAIDYYEVWVNGVYYEDTIDDSVAWTVTGLTAGTSYDFQLKTVDVLGFKSALSNTSTESTTGDSVFPTTGLFAYYKLDDTTGAVVDSWGSNDGTNNGATRGVTGKIGNCFSFNGSSNYVDLGDLNMNTQNAYSLGCWFKTTATGARAILVKDNTTTQRFFMLFINNGNVQFARFDASNSLLANFASPSTYNDGNWHLAVVTFSTTNGSRIYVDGTQVATDSNTTQNRTGTGTNNLIAQRNSAIYFGGEIDECFLIENHELTSADVTTIWNGGAGITL